MDVHLTITHLCECSLGYSRRSTQRGSKDVSSSPGGKNCISRTPSFDWKRKPVCVPCELIHSGISQLENTECLQNHPHADSYKDNADFYNAPGPVRVY